MGLVISPSQGGIPEPDLNLAPDTLPKEETIEAPAAELEEKPVLEQLRPQRRAHNTTAIGNRLMGDLMRDYGLSQAQAAGIVGSLATESANFQTLQEINPMVPGSRGGWGFAQWTGPRRRAMESWSAERGLDLSSYDANYGYLRHELDNTPEGRILDQVRQAKTPVEAAQIFTGSAAEGRGFLRPGIVGMSSRIRYAEGYAGSEPGSFEQWEGMSQRPESSSGGPQKDAKLTSHQVRMDALSAMFDGFFGAAAEEEEDELDIFAKLGDIPVEEIEMIDPELGETPLDGIPEA